MPEYRFYSIQKNGHIGGPAADVIALDDKAALALAKVRINGHDIEIWEGPRLVAYIVPEKGNGELDARRG